MSAVREGFACSGRNGIAKWAARMTNGEKYRPAKSLSFPVRNDGHTCLSRWSLIKRIAIAASESGLASAVRLAPRPTDGLDRLPITFTSAGGGRGFGSGPDRYPTDRVRDEVRKGHGEGVLAIGARVISADRDPA